MLTSLKKQHNKKRSADVYVGVAATYIPYKNCGVFIILFLREQIRERAMRCCYRALSLAVMKEPLDERNPKEPRKFYRTRKKTYRVRAVYEMTQEFL